MPPPDHSRNEDFANAIRIAREEERRIDDEERREAREESREDGHDKDKDRKESVDGHSNLMFEMAQPFCDLAAVGELASKRPGSVFFRITDCAKRLICDMVSKTFHYPDHYEEAISPDRLLHSLDSHPSPFIPDESRSRLSGAVTG
jgi:hypothetical protein